MRDIKRETCSGPWQSIDTKLMKTPEVTATGLYHSVELLDLDEVCHLASLRPSAWVSTEYKCKGADGDSVGYIIVAIQTCTAIARVIY